MTLPPEINAARYYELEIKARGFDILQELEVLNDRVLMLKNEKTKIFKELQTLYKKVQDNADAVNAEKAALLEKENIQKSTTTIKKNEDKNRTVKTVHDVSGK